MDALTPGQPADDFEGRVRAAQAGLQHGIDRAGLRGDPMQHPLEALADIVGLFPDLVTRMSAATSQAALGIDPAAVVRLEHAAAQGADRRAAELARTHNRRTLVTLGGVFIAAVVGAAIVGGLWEHGRQTALVTSTEAGISAAFRDSPQSAAAWLNLMRSNDPAQALADCKGKAVTVLEGRRACSVPMWLDPPRSSTPGAASR